MNVTRRTAAIFFLKALVTLGCLWWLSGYLDVHTVRNALAGINPLLVVLAIGLHLASYAAGALRWWLLFRHLGSAAKFRQILPSYYLGVFFNNVLPSAYGGDLARSARLYLSGMSGSALVGSALMDRLLGLAAVVALGGTGLAFAPGAAIDNVASIAFMLGLLLLIAALVVVILPKWAGAMDSGKEERWPRLHAVLSCFPRFHSSPGLLARAFGLSVLNQMLVVAVFLVLAPGLGIDIALPRFVVVLMLVFLVASLPISLGGLGPREGALMSLLLPLGADAAAVLALSMAYLVVLWGSALPGALMLLLREPGSRRITGTPAS